MLLEVICVPPCSEMEVMAEVAIPNYTSGSTWMMEHESTGKLPMMVANAVATPTNHKMPVCLLNPGTEPTMIYKGTKIVFTESMD